MSILTYSELYKSPWTLSINISAFIIQLRPLATLRPYTIIHRPTVRCLHCTFIIQLRPLATLLPQTIIHRPTVRCLHCTLIIQLRPLATLPPPDYHIQTNRQMSPPYPNLYDSTTEIFTLSEWKFVNYQIRDFLAFSQNITGSWGTLPLYF